MKKVFNALIKAQFGGIVVGQFLCRTGLCSSLGDVSDALVAVPSPCRD